MNNKSRIPSLSAAVAAVLLAAAGGHRAGAADVDTAPVVHAGTPNNTGLFGQYYSLQQATVVGAEPLLSATVAAGTNFTANGFPILQSALNQAPTNATGYSIINSPNTTNAPFTFSTLTDNITARWSGYINIDATQAGLTTFFTSSDDGSVLYVDGVRVVNNNLAQAVTERSGTITLAAGPHEVVVAFYEGGGGAGMEFRYDPAGADAKQIVPLVIPAGSTAPAGQQVLTGVQNAALDLTAQTTNFANPGTIGNLTITHALQANLGAMTFKGGNTLNFKGAAGRFASTSFTGGQTNVLATSTESAFNQDIALGVLNDNGTATRLQKTGPGQLVLDQTTVANSMVGGSVIEIRGGGLVIAGSGAAGAFSPLGSASIELGSVLPSPAPTGVTIAPSTLSLTSKTGNYTLDNAISVTSSNLIIAQQLANPAGNTTLTQGGSVGVSAAPAAVANAIITLGSATNGISVAPGATATFQANNGYTINFAGGLSGAGNVAFNPGIYTINNTIAPGGTLTATGTSTFSLNVTNSVNKSLIVPGNNSVINYNANTAGGGNLLGVTGTGAQVNIASTVTSIGSDSFNIGGASVLAVPNATIAGQLTRGTNLTIGTASIIAEGAAGVNNTIGNLGTASDLFFGLGANLADNVTVGSIPGATPWRGIATDRTARTLTGGTITALSDFAFSNVPGAFQNLTVQGVSIATPNGPVVANVAMGTSRVLLGTNSALTNGVTFTISSGSAIQFNGANALGSNVNGNLNAPVVVYGGATADPGPAGSMSGNVHLLTGGILQVNDANNFGGAGAITAESGAVVDISGNVGVFGNVNATQNVANLPAGVLHKLGIDSITSLAASTNPAGNFQIQGANRTQTITLSAGTPTRSGIVSGLLTNDNAARTLNPGTVSIGAGGATFAATTGGAFTIAAPVSVTAGGNRSLTIGTTRIVEAPTNNDIRSGTVILSSTTNNWGAGADALAQLNLVGRSNLQNLGGVAVSALPQGTGLAVSLGGIYQINGGTGGATTTVQLGQLTPQGGVINLNRNATTPDSLIVNLNAPISRSNTFGPGNRGSVNFQTISGQVLGTSDKVTFANAVDAPARVNGTSGVINMVAPWMVGLESGTAANANLVSPTFLDIDDPTATGFKPVTYVALPAGAGTGDEIVDVTSATAVTGTKAIAALRINAALTGTGTISLSTGGLMLRGNGLNNTAVTHTPAFSFGGVEAVLTNASNRADAFSGLLSGTGGLTKLGGNSLVLSNAGSTLTGGITINESNLRPGVNNGIPTGNVLTINAAGVLDLNNFDQSFRGLQGNGVVNNQTGAAKTLTLNTLNAGDSFDFTGTIRNAAQGVALTKTGPGTQILSGTLGYTGATAVSGGRLVVDGVSTAVSAYTVAASATLAGSGIITGAVSGSASGTIAPGGVTAGTAVGQLRIGALTLAANSTLALDLNGAIAGTGSASGTGYDQLDVVGAVALTGANLQLQLNYAPALGDKLFVLNNDQIDAIVGSFASLNGVATPLGQGSLFNLTSSFDSQSYQFQISYTGEFYGGATSNIGNDVVLVAVPEPGATLLFGAAALGLVARRRRHAFGK